ncbi:MAG TPA: cobalamin-dependent protein [Arenicellales bacterium]|nr:cobalamin-dependent protein [Arenicellales bacterium]
MDDQLLEQFDALRGDAIRQAAADCEQAFPEMIARFGRRGREACEEDLGFHLDFMRPALESGDRSPFIAYLGWLSQVLESRGVPLDSLPFSLQSLARFFESRMGDDSARAITELLQGGIEALSEGIEAPGFDDGSPEPWEEAQAYGEAVLSGDRARAGQAFDLALARSRQLPHSQVHVIQPALYQLGLLWQQNRISVAQEHMASALTQTLMAQAFGRVTPLPPNGRVVVLACVQGNQHAIGLRMVSDAFEMAGWTVNFLGADTPHEHLARHVAEHRPELVGLSVSLPFHLKSLREAVNMLRAKLGDDCPRVAAGGLVINQFPLLASAIGVELLGRDAVAAVERLT